MIFRLGCKGGKIPKVVFDGVPTLVRYFCQPTRFQLMVPVPNHNVTKNRTGHRMHVDGPQIFEWILTTIAFQEIGTCLARKKLSLPKNTSKWPIFVCTNLSLPNCLHSNSVQIYIKVKVIFIKMFFSRTIASLENGGVWANFPNAVVKCG